MILTTLKSIALSITLMFNGNSLANSNEQACQCPTAQLEANCNEQSIKQPSWLDWMFNKTSNQFHFFQLMELIHANDELSSVQNDNDSELEKASA